MAGLQYKTGFWESMVHNIEGNSVWSKLVPKPQFRKFGTCAWFCWRSSHILHALHDVLSGYLQHYKQIEYEYHILDFSG